MGEALYALGGVMAGVLLDQGIQLVRDARQHRRERLETIAASQRQQYELLEASLRRLENRVAGNSGLLRGVLAGRIEIGDDLTGYLDDDELIEER